MNKTTIAVPEMTAKAYADINQISREKINDMCIAGDLPCRKIGKTPAADTRDGRIWWVNVAKLNEQLQ